MIIKSKKIKPISKDTNKERLNYKRRFKYVPMKKKLLNLKRIKFVSNFGYSKLKVFIFKISHLCQNTRKLVLAVLNSQRNFKWIRKLWRSWKKTKQLKNDLFNQHNHYLKFNNNMFLQYQTHKWIRNKLKMAKLKDQLVLHSFLLSRLHQFY